jgi:Uma2 family endonuclease
MVAMSIAEAWPAAGQPFTVADLELMPDDGRRYELLDGALIVSPRPRISHQEVATEMTSRLRAACSPHRPGRWTVPALICRASSSQRSPGKVGAVPGGR